MTEYAMPPETVRTLIAALEARGVAVCVGGGWAIDALVGEVTRKHSDLDIWVDAAHTEGLFAGLADQGVDRIHPWPGDRPWNFVVGDGHSRRVDLHLYESLGDGRLHYGSVNTPFLFTAHDLSGDGDVGECEFNANLRSSPCRTTPATRCVKSIDTMSLCCANTSVYQRLRTASRSTAARANSSTQSCRMAAATKGLLPQVRSAALGTRAPARLVRLGDLDGALVRLGDADLVAERIAQRAVDAV